MRSPRRWSCSVDAGHLLVERLGPQVEVLAAGGQGVAELLPGHPGGHVGGGVTVCSRSRPSRAISSLACCVEGGGQLGVGLRLAERRCGNGPRRGPRRRWRRCRGAARITVVNMGATVPRGCDRTADPVHRPATTGPRASRRATVGPPWPGSACRTMLDAPPATVWAYLEDIDTHVHWMHDAVRIRFLGDRRRPAWAPATSATPRSGPSSSPT